MKKQLAKLISVFLFVSILMISAQAADLEPPVSPDPLSPYIGVASASIGLSHLNSSNAQVTGTIVLKPGYYANATVTLYKEWNSTPVTSWTQTSTHIWISQSYSISSGFTYYATIAATIYDSNNNYVDSVNLESYHVSF